MLNNMYTYVRIDQNGNLTKLLTNIYTPASEMDNIYLLIREVENNKGKIMDFFALRLCIKGK